MQHQASNVIAFPMQTFKPGDATACRIPVPYCRTERRILPETIAAMFVRHESGDVLVLDRRLDSEHARIAASMTLANAVGTVWAWTSTEDVGRAHRQLVGV